MFSFFSLETFVLPLARGYAEPNLSSDAKCPKINEILDSLAGLQEKVENNLEVKIVTLLELDHKHNT